MPLYDFIDDHVDDSSNENEDFPNNKFSPASHQINAVEAENALFLCPQQFFSIKGLEESDTPSTRFSHFKEQLVGDKKSFRLETMSSQLLGY